jgi:hypothetical protein
MAAQSVTPASLVKPSGIFHCSGVLPYCMYGNSVYFYLGRTRCGKLLTYTGKRDIEPDGSYEPPATTAAREFVEESLGTILAHAECLEKCRACDLSQVMLSHTPKNTPCYTFLVEVPFKRHYASCFAKARDFLDFVGVRDQRFFEFEEIKGVCFDTLNTKVRHAWHVAGMLTADDEWAKVQHISSSISVEEDRIGPPRPNRTFAENWRVREIRK